MRAERLGTRCGSQSFSAASWSADGVIEFSSREVGAYGGSTALVKFDIGVRIPDRPPHFLKWRSDAAKEDGRWPAERREAS